MDKVLCNTARGHEYTPTPPTPPLLLMMTACENAIAHGLHSPSIAFIVSIYGYLIKIFDGCESGWKGVNKHANERNLTGYYTPFLLPKQVGQI